MPVTWVATTLLVAVVPELGALVMSLRGYLRHHYAHYLYMFLTWSFLALGNFLIGMGYLFSDLSTYRVGIVISGPLAFAIMMLVNDISQESVEPLKLGIVTVAITLLTAFAFDPQSVQFHFTLLGEWAPGDDRALFNSWVRSIPLSRPDVVVLYGKDSR